MTLNRAGYFGKLSTGIIYELNPKHQLEGSIGYYSIDGINYSQYNSSYHYSPWMVEWSDRSWYPLQIGAFVVYAPSNKYFTESPSKYPYENYYDETAIRYGADIGQCFSLSSPGFEIAYRFRVIDSGLIAIYNNVHRDLQYYVSSVLELHYRF